MAVLSLSTVVSPANQPRLINEGTPSQYNPAVAAGFLRPWFVASPSTPGDAGGGTVTLAFEMRPSADNVPVFLAITELWCNCNEVTAGLSVTIQSAVTADFEHPLFRRQIVDQASTDISNLLITPDKPYYFGEGLVGSVLRNDIVWSVNTNGKNYRMFAAGWVADRPFLIPRSFTP